MDMKDVQASIAALTAAVAAQTEQTGKVLEAIKPAKAPEPEPAPAAETIDPDVEKHLDRAAKEGKLTAANAAELTQTLMGLPSAARSAVVDTLEVVAKLDIKSTPPQGEAGTPVVRDDYDKMAALLNSPELGQMGIVMTGDSIRKFAKANSFSPSRHTICAVPPHMLGKAHEIRDDSGQVTNLVAETEPKQIKAV